MLETSEIDADFFTPAANTSLATIFSNTQTDRNDENKSLIYVPETPMALVENHKSAGDVHKETSASQCLFATSVSAYEWVENKYNLRDKLGFAIVKDIKDDVHSLIIYTSEKRTLSLATITSKFVINVQKDVNISYYDNYNKYWLISSAASKISDIVKCLENFKVNVTYLNDAEISSPKDVTETVPDQLPNESLDIDTDSLTNQKKDSILKRMATMGQSVLPPSNNIVSKSTDSSDTNDYDHPSLPRHKSVKSLPKKHSTEKNAYSGKQYNNELSKILPNTLKIQDSIIPVNVKKFESFYENNMHSLITEQRISNSELRININRLSDKVDHLCDKTLSGGIQSHSLNNQNEIVDKLLKEYESKIFVYEKFIKLKGFECNLLFTNENEPSSSVKIDSIVETEKDKENQALEINELNKKIDLLTNAFSQMTEKHKQHEEILLKEIYTLKQDLNDKNESLHTISKSVQSIAANSNSEEYSNKLKNIMNSTFQTISSKFNDEDSYLGNVVKSIVAKIIKKTTMESLNDIN
ncbi:unnamed protein product [Pieris macdunnoughi]|uniref:Uncharacterized protein n=1 Tax=Pieris macdunnoughi TaxID=345717 RepID=A0A821NA76_9NEOP|nr:unnamed protein product [Pieris macdunnoughi]